MELKTGIYKHSKTGNEYLVHFFAKHSETLEDLVVYEALYQNSVSKFWARPVSMFFEEVSINGETKPRFVWVREN